MAIKPARVSDDPRYLRVIREATDGVIRHHDSRHFILVEHGAFNGRDLRAWPEGRLFSPSHLVGVT